MGRVGKVSSPWMEEIKPSSNIWSLHIKEIWEYRDLLSIWIKRDIYSVYKQTILGPIWFFVQPLLTAIAYVFIFSRIAKFSTENTPPVIFYLSGIVLWSYFSDCVLKTSGFLKENASILSKVYFPRLIIPLSIIFSNLLKLGIQLLLLTIISAYYYIKHPGSFSPNISLLILPLLILLIGALGMGAGMIVASLTNKYKDLVHLINFGIQLLMFISPVFFPVSSITDPAFKKFILLNPMTGIIEMFRYALTGAGYFSWELLTYDILVIICLLFSGVIIFNKMERDFVDSI